MNMNSSQEKSKIIKSECSSEKSFSNLGKKTYEISKQDYETTQFRKNNSYHFSNKKDKTPNLSKQKKSFAEDNSVFNNISESSISGRQFENSEICEEFKGVFDPNYKNASRDKLNNSNNWREKESDKRNTNTNHFYSNTNYRNQDRNSNETSLVDDIRKKQMYNDLNFCDIKKKMYYAKQNSRISNLEIFEVESAWKDWITNITRECLNSFSYEDFPVQGISKFEDLEEFKWLEHFYPLWWQENWNDFLRKLQKKFNNSIRKLKNYLKCTIQCWNTSFKDFVTAFIEVEKKVSRLKHIAGILCETNNDEKLEAILSILKERIEKMLKRVENMDIYSLASIDNIEDLLEEVKNKKDIFEQVFNPDFTPYERSKYSLDNFIKEIEFEVEKFTNVVNSFEPESKEPYSLKYFTFKEARKFSEYLEIFQLYKIESCRFYKAHMKKLHSNLDNNIKYLIDYNIPLNADPKFIELLLRILGYFTICKPFETQIKSKIELIRGRQQIYDHYDNRSFKDLEGEISKIKKDFKNAYENALNFNKFCDYMEKLAMEMESMKESIRDQLDRRFSEIRFPQEEERKFEKVSFSQPNEDTLNFSQGFSYSAAYKKCENQKINIYETVKVEEPRKHHDDWTSRLKPQRKEYLKSSNTSNFHFPSSFFFNRDDRNTNSFSRIEVEDMKIAPNLNPDTPSKEEKLYKNSYLLGRLC